jgi:hypothetical protein
LPSSRSAQSGAAPIRTVRELVQRIDTFDTRYNATSQPFVWTATADSIHRQAQPACENN